MSNNVNEKYSKDKQLFDDEKEKSITNSRKNRSFIDSILKSNDEHAIKKLFEEYFYIHAKNNNNDRITWNDLNFIINEILQINTNDLNLSEATNLFYQMYQLQYSKNNLIPITLKNEEKKFILKKTKSEQELLSKLKEYDASKNTKKIKNQ